MSIQNLENDLRKWTELLASRAGESREFVTEFLDLLDNSEGIKREYVHYMKSNTFLGEYSVCDMTVVDIMIWQMDHFKSDLDKGLYDMQSNPDKMLLRAFYTMLKMERDPQAYTERYASDTGTDYPGKF